jgi:hypothetical protein
MNDFGHTPPSEKQGSSIAGRLRFGALLATLLAALGYLLASGALSSDGSGSSSASACPQSRVPSVVKLEPAQLSPLRARVAAVVPARLARLYEEGSVEGASFFDDAEPTGPTVSPGARREGGYEMRWRASSGAAIVADVLVFADVSAAQRFAALAASPGCRRQASGGSTARPAGARNLTWVNPDGVTQGDVVFARGRRVYRVGEVPPGASSHPLGEVQLHDIFVVVDTLSCLISEARCTATSRALPT